MGTDRDVGGGGDSGGPQERCEEDALRCSPEMSAREVCEGGIWVAQDFVCASSVRVAAGDGTPCAVKADGTFVCWWGRSELRVFDVATPEVPGTLQSMEDVNYNQSLSVSAAVLTKDGTLVDLHGKYIPDVIQFEPSRHDICWVTKDASAACSEFGPLTASPAAQVAIDMNRRCALLQDGSVVCHTGQQAAPVTLKGRYTDIDMGSYVLCGVDLLGKVWCTNVIDETLTRWSPMDGAYTKVAVSDFGLCAMLEDGQLECASDIVNGGELYQPPGVFTQVDAGDWTLCGIRIDGSVACWRQDSSSDELKMLLTPDGW